MVVKVVFVVKRVTVVTARMPMVVERVILVAKGEIFMDRKSRRCG